MLSEPYKLSGGNARPRACFFVAAPLVADWAEIILGIRKEIEQTHDLTIMTCRGFALGRCLTEKALQVQTGESDLLGKVMCSSCRHAGASLAAGQGQAIDEFVEPEDILLAESLVDSCQNPLSFEFDGLPVGRMASYDEMMKQKSGVSYLKLGKELYEDLKLFIVTYLAFKRFLATGQINAVVVLNAAYVINRAVEQAALSSGVKVIYGLGGGSPTSALKSFYLLDEPQAIRKLPKSKDWLSKSKLPIDKKMVRLVEEDLAAKIRGSAHISYSKDAARVQDEVVEGAIEDWRRKVTGGAVLFIPLSSPDEFEVHDFAFTGQTENGENLQEEWIKRLLIWARHLPEILFVFRPHPRMFPNPRDSVTSPLAHTITALFQDVPENVVINLPANGNSPYRVGHLCDAVLGLKSSLPLELMALGVPSISIMPEVLDAYPTPTDKKAPKNASELRDLLWEASQIDSISFQKHAFRWLAFVNHGVTMGSNLGYPDDREESFPTSPANPSTNFRALKSFLRSLLQLGPFKLLLFVYQSIRVTRKTAQSANEDFTGYDDASETVDDTGYITDAALRLRGLLKV